MQKDLLRSLLTATKGIRVGSGTGRRQSSAAGTGGDRRPSGVVGFWLDGAGPRAKNNVELNC
jgi:hypothetical protein